MAYTLAVLPIARELGLKVIIATATVALQEQVTQKDLPEILEASDLNFSVSLAKGRGRYLCLSKLDMLLSGSDSLQAMMDLYGDDVSGEATTCSTSRCLLRLATARGMVIAIPGARSSARRTGVRLPSITPNVWALNAVISASVAFIKRATRWPLRIVLLATTT